MIECLVCGKAFEDRGNSPMVCGQRADGDPYSECAMEGGRRGWWDWTEEQRWAYARGQRARFQLEVRVLQAKTDFVELVVAPAIGADPTKLSRVVGLSDKWE